MPAARGKVIVFGIAFWYPLAGVTYQFLHYLVGLRRLGYDAYYVEDSDRWLYVPDLGDTSPDPSPNVKTVGALLDAHGFAGKWAFRSDGKPFGMTCAQIDQLYRDAYAFLNVTGAQELREEHMACQRRIYVESDPVAAQVKVATGEPETIAALSAHDAHFTFGENFGAKDCLVPIERFRWLPTRQPVVVDWWDSPAPARAAYTTIATWRNKGKDVEWRGETYTWSKDREFMKIIDLPLRRPEAFELATGNDEGVPELLARNGWRHADCVHVSRDMERYRSYIQGSRAELTVAKDQNIRLRSGWFSDRSACYLAAGRPVITQETGFSNVLPAGRGLFGFSTLDDVLAAVDAIESDYDAHCCAAREIGREYFSAEKVLASLMSRAGL